MLAYHEICNMIRSGAKKGSDSTGNSGPYVTDGSTWVGYDDVDMIMKKTKYCMDMDLGGVSAWTVDLDDFTNSCCEEPFPLLRAINRGLGRLSTPKPYGNNCQKPTYVTPPPITMSSTEDSGQAGIPNQSSTTTSPWWTQPSSSSTQRPQMSSRPTTKPPVPSTMAPTEGTTIPSPVNVMPPPQEELCDKIGTHKKDDLSCEKYYTCAHLNQWQGHWLSQSCAPGLNWHAEHGHCDWPDHAKCTVVDQRKTTSLKPTEATTQRTSMETTERTTQRPSTKPTERTTRVTRRPTTTQRIITTKRTTTTELPMTTHQHQDETTNYYTTTLIPETTMRTQPQTAATTTKKPSKKVKCESGKYYRHKDCSMFYVCTNNRKVPMMCPIGLQFSVDDVTCKLAEDVKCVSKKDYLKLLKKHYGKSHAYNAKLLKAHANDACETGFTSYPGECNKYLQCDIDHYIERECTSGLNWNSNLNICDWPENSNCDSIPIDEN